jgi:hypothetical protein
MKESFIKGDTARFLASFQQNILSAIDRNVYITQVESYNHTMLSITVRSAARVLVPRGALPGAATTSVLQKRGYHENIVEHYENPRNVGSLDKNDRSVGTVR